MPADVTVLRLRPGVEWQHVGGEVVVLDLDTSSYLGVNDTGALLWPMIADGATEVQLVESLMLRHDVGVDEASADVRAFVDQLRSLALVEQL